MSLLLVVAICTVGLPSGDFRCYDTGFASPEYVDCTDAPAPPIGVPERGSGVIRWGNTVGGEFVMDGGAVYLWSGWQVVSGNLVRAIIGVDEDLIFNDGFDRICYQGWF